MRDRVNKNDIILYNDEIICEWQDKLTEIQQTIANHDRAIAEANRIISNLNAKIHPVEASIRDVKAKIVPREVFLHAKREHQNRHYHYFDYNNYNMLDSRDPELTTLRSQANHLIAQKEPWVAARGEKEELVRQCNAENNRLKQQQDFIAFHIPNAKTFMANLRNKPEDFFSQFKSTVINQFGQYEKEHPFSQSEIVRWCLSNIENKIDGILESNHLEEKNRAYQLHYACLCGFLWYLLDEVERENNAANCSFANMLMGFLQEAHIADQGDLPNELVTGLSVRNQFMFFRNKNRELYLEMDINKLHEDEHQAYQRAYQDFQHICDSKLQNDYPLLYEPARCLLSNTAEKKAAQPADFKSYTTSLKAGKAVFLYVSEQIRDEDYDPDALSNIAVLADKADGAPSPKKKLGGVLLGILGAALITMSVCAVLASFAVASPFSIIGIAIGTTLLAQSLSISMGGVGLVALGGGMGLFAHGTRHGLSKSLKQCAKAGQQLEENKRSFQEFTVWA